MSFYGSEIYSVDKKYRVNLPFKMRKHLSEKIDAKFFAICHPVKQCIYLYSEEEWKKMEEKFFKLDSFFDDEADDFKNQLFEFASECEIGAQSRITIPEKMLKKIGVKNEVKIIGAGNHLMLWNPKIYDTTFNGKKNMKELSQKIFEKLK